MITLGIHSVVVISVVSLSFICFVYYISYINAQAYIPRVLVRFVLMRRFVIVDFYIST